MGRHCARDSLVFRSIDLGVAGAALLELPGWVFWVSPAKVLRDTIIQAERVGQMLRAHGVELSIFRVFSVLCRGAFVGLFLPSGP